MQKNVAGQRIGVQMVSASDGSAFTGSVTVYVTGDAGSQAIGSVGSGVCTHEGNGYHSYAPAQAETNYDLIAFTFIGSGAVPVTVQVYTAINPVTAVPTAAANATAVRSELGLTGSLDSAFDAIPTVSEFNARTIAAADYATAAQATAIETDTQDIQTRLPVALVSGRMDASVGAYQAGLAPPTAAENGAAGWNRMLVDHTSTGSFGAGVGYIITTVAAILVGVNQLTSRVSSSVATMFTDLIQMITGSGTANAQWTEKAMELAPGGGSDTGARSVTVTVTLGGDPLEGATVRLTKGAETKVQDTDIDGEAAFNCNDGTWTVAITAPNASFTGATLTVDGDETPTYAMTADSITPSSPSLVTGYYVCYDQLGVVETGVTITAKCVKVPTDKGFALDSATRTATSGAGGLAQFTNMIPGATYQIWRGTGEKYSVKIADDATGSVELNSILGT